MAVLKEIQPKELRSNPFKLIGDDWMLIAAGSEEKANAMTASWGGLGVMWNKKVAFVAIRPQRFTKEFVDAGETFSLSFFPKKYKKTMAYFGSVSGRDEDKIAKSGLSLVHDLEAPYFKEAKLVLICRKLMQQDFEPGNMLDESINPTYYPGSDHHTLYIAEIEKVLASR